jgi:hypothetical protein
MKGKKLMIVVRAALLVSALLLSTTALAGGLGYYNWSANTTGFVGEFTNSGAGGGVKANTLGTSSIGLYGSATGGTAQATRGYNSSSGYGVYGRSVSGTGVYGENNSTTSGYGGFFTGRDGVKGYTTAANGYAGWFTATGATGFGVRAQSSAATGYGVYSTGGYMGVYGEGPYRGGYFVGTGSAGEGVRGYTASTGGDGVNAYATGEGGTGVHAVTTGEAGSAVVAWAYGEGAWAGDFWSGAGDGVWADGAEGHWDLYVPNYAYIAGTIFGPSGGMSILARNDGTGALEPGDLVAFKGFDPSALGQGVVSVIKAGAAQGVVVGVVQGAYVVDPDAPVPSVAAAPETTPPQRDAGTVAPAPVPEGEEPAAPLQVPDVEQPAAPIPPAQAANGSIAKPDVGHFVEGRVEAGQYLVVMFQGFARVNVSATKPIQAGDWIVAGPDGVATGASVRSTASVLEKGYLIIGRALEALESGKGTIFVQVNVR